MARRGSMLGYEQTVMYGRYSEDLGQYAKSQAKRIRAMKRNEELLLENQSGFKKYGKSAWKRTLVKYLVTFWRYTFGKIGEDWLFLALLGTLMACLSFFMDQVIKILFKARLTLYNSKQLGSDNVMIRYFLWTMPSIFLILFASGFVHLVSPQAVGSGIPEMKTILRGVVLKEYLTFKTLIAKMVGLAMTLGSGLPLGKEGPFVHMASIVATLLSQLVASFKGIYENESRTGEMLAAACAIGVAATFYSPIGGVLFSIEVTSVYFAVRNYWRGFFAACCGAAVWRLLVVWVLKEEESITALFSTNFSSDLPFDPQELIIFCLIGVVCGFAGAGYVAFHRKLVHFNRRYLTCSILQRNRFAYPFLVTLIVTTFTFPDFLGKYTASLVSTHDSVEHFFSNKTWISSEPDSETQEILKHWKTDQSSIFFHLSLYIVMLWWTSALASTIPVPSGVFIPVFKMGAAFGRLVGEVTHLLLQGSVSFGASRIPIVPGGYAVVGAAAFSGAVTHTISTTVIVFELTGQMTHIIPVIAAVLIANAIAQTLQPSIYDSIIQIKQLPFLPSIVSTSSVGHLIMAEDFMIRDVVCIWTRCTYKQLADILNRHLRITCFPLVESRENMILLGSIHRHELSYILSHQLGRERRLQEFQRRYSTQDGARVSLSGESGTRRDSASGGGGGGGVMAVNGGSLMGVPQQQQQQSQKINGGGSNNGVGNKSDTLIGELEPPPAVVAAVEQNVPTSSGNNVLKRIGSLNRRASRFAVTQIGGAANTGAPGIVASKNTVLALGGVKTLDPESSGRPYSPPPASAPGSPKSIKSILKPNVSYTISSYSTLGHDFKLNSAWEKIFNKSQKLKDAKNSVGLLSSSLPSTPNVQRRVQLPRERVIDMSPEEQRAWEEEQLNCTIDLIKCHIDPAPFQLVGHTSLLKVHTLFSMLQLSHTYVTHIGRLVGVVALKDLRVAIERMNAGTLVPKAPPNLAHYHRKISEEKLLEDGEDNVIIQETVVETPSSHIPSTSTSTVPSLSS